MRGREWRERERGGERGGRQRAEGRRGEQRGKKRRGAERVHLSDTVSLYVFMMEGAQGHRGRSAVSMENAASPGVPDGRE